MQTRPTTCGIACMMMILDAFKGIDLTSATEGRFRKRLKLRGWDLVPAINIARELKDTGLSVRVRHEDPFRFWNFLHESDPELFQAQQEAHGRSARAGIRVEQGAITAQDIYREIDNGSLVIFGLDLGDNIKHAILLCSREGEILRAVDPLSGSMEKDAESLLRSAPKEGGAWFISAQMKD